MKEIKKLPKNAKFDYKDAIGTKIYHTKRRRYEVHTLHYGGTKVIISKPKDE